MPATLAEGLDAGAAAQTELNRTELTRSPPDVSASRSTDLDTTKESATARDPLPDMPATLAEGIADAVGAQYAEREFDAEEHMRNLGEGVADAARAERELAVNTQERVLTDADREALIDYGGDTAHGREAYNDRLREGMINGTDPAVARLDAAFKVEVREETTVFRGEHAASRETYYIAFDQIEPGDVYPASGYMSTTPELSVTEEYARESGNYPVVFEITLPPGTHVACLDNYNEEHQAETLLPRDSLLEFVGVEERDDLTVVQWRYIQQGLP